MNFGDIFSRTCFMKGRRVPGHARLRFSTHQKCRYLNWVALIFLAFVQEPNFVLENSHFRLLLTSTKQRWLKRDHLNNRGLDEIRRRLQADNATFMTLLRLGPSWPVKILISLPALLTIFPTLINAQVSWMRKANFPDSKYRASSFSIGSKGYVGAGLYAEMGDFWEYDPILNSMRSDGLYFYKMRAGDFVKIRKMVFLK